MTALAADCGAHPSALAHALRDNDRHGIGLHFCPDWRLSGSSASSSRLAVKLIAPLGAIASVFLMIGLPPDTWIRLAVRLAIGLVIYFLYGRTHSHLAGAFLSIGEIPPETKRVETGG